MRGTQHTSPDPPDAAARPFAIDPDRLYDVGRDGVPHTGDTTAMEWLGARHRRLIATFAATSALVAALAGLTALLFVLGARRAAAVTALATLAAAPLLLLGTALDWWRQRQARRRHRTRPEDFPPGA